MSPVIIPNGYTKKYVDGMISHEQQLHDIEMAMRHVSDASDVVVCEGAWLIAPSVASANVHDAKVASSIGADMVLVANGGLGELTMLFFHDKSFAKAGDSVNPIPLLTHDF
jgi:dethiobiotin synthetase